MNLSSPLLIGVVLIVIGAAFGLLAYGMMTSRRAAADQGSGDQSENGEPMADQAEVGTTAPSAARPEAEAPPPTVLFRPSSAAEGPPPTVRSSPAPAASPPPPPVQIVPAKPAPPAVPAGRIPVAQLLRDEVSGELIIQVGGREYRSAAELKPSKDWTRVEYAARDLSNWLASDQAPPAPTRQAGPPVSSSPAAGGAAAAEPTVEPTLLRPRSMIEEINEILGQHVIEAGLSDKGIKLIAAPGGGVRVMIGLNTYDLSEVPDEQISQLIHQAVAAWEGQK
jgi:hypothetical protein